MMKKLVLLLCLCTVLSCKKDDVDDITKFNWVLTTATVNPAMTVNGKTSTDYKNLMGAESCMGGNYTLTFLPTGVYQYSSSGALCDMVPNSANQKWARDGAKVTLTGYFGASSDLSIVGETMEFATTFTNKDIPYTIKYIYSAKSK